MKQSKLGDRKAKWLTKAVVINTAQLAMLTPAFQHSWILDVISTLKMVSPLAE